MLDFGVRGTALLDALLVSERRLSRAPELVRRDSCGDREDPRAQVRGVLEPVVRAQRTQERFLERVLGALASHAAEQEPEHPVTVVGVEVLERGRNHGLHHPLETPPTRRM